MQDPAGFMNALDLSVDCLVRKRRPAVIDEEHWARVNYEIYFFADGEGMRRFLDRPHKYCGIVTDPVSQERFRPVEDSPRIDRKGIPYYFLSDSTMAVFEEHAESLALPNYKMKM